MSGSETEITRLLKSWGKGDQTAIDLLMEHVYPELHRRARRLFWHERPSHTLQPTALVNEAYLRLVDQKTTDWEDRSHFFRVATRAMRQKLIDHARGRLAEKRGRGQVGEAIDEGLPAKTQSQERDLIALHEALEDLTRMDERQARIVELRYFAGLTIDETANALNCSPATVNREWRSARIWLRLQMKRGGSG